jgi:hypothetical protein
MARHNAVRVAVGFDQDPLSDSDNIEGITPSSGETFNVPGVGSVYAGVRRNPTHSYGQRRIAADGSASYAGNAQSRYTQSLCHVDTLADLISTYEGPVTANIRALGTTYAEYNCWLRFEYQEIANHPDWFDVEWVFTIEEAL